MARRRHGLFWLFWRRLLFVLALPALASAALLLVANTHAGLRLVGAGLEVLAGGQLRLEGLAGVLPHRPRATRVELRDAEGAWLRVDDAALDLAPFALLRGELVVDLLSAGAVEVLRRPAWPAPVAEPRVPSWPVRLERLRVARLSLDGVLPGVPGLAVEGSAALEDSGALKAQLRAGVPDCPDQYRLALAGDATAQRFDLEVREPLDGAVAALAAHLGWRLPPIPGRDLRLAAAARRVGEVWDVESGRMDVASGTVRAQGRLAPDALSLDWTLDLPDVGAVLPGGSGPVQVVGEVAGSPADPRIVVGARAGDGLVLPGGARVADLVFDAVLTDLRGGVEVEASARVAGLAVGPLTGEIAVAARGPVAALSLGAQAGLQAGGESVRVDLDGRLDGVGRALAVERLEAVARNETLRLLAPARLDLSDGVAVDRVRLGLRQGVIEVAGRLAPELALDAVAADVPADLLRLIVPVPGLSGSIGGQARLTGAPGALGGQVRVTGEGLRLTEGPGRALPPASLQVTVRLGPAGAEVDARAEAGKGGHVALRGRVGGGSTTGDSALDLRADGRLDLAALDPLLSGAGRRARGKADLTARIGGTLAAPRFDGDVRLVDGAWWDRSIGLVLTDVHGRLGLAGDSVRVERVEARAGPGSVALDGTVRWLAPGIPLDLTVRARDARPLQRDDVDLQVSGEVRLRGATVEDLTLAGALRLDGVDIRLPERLPAAVATLEVREVGNRRAPPPGARGRPPRLDLALDLALSAPRGVAVRGRGLDAELGGDVHLRGPLTAPVATGGFDLVRGQFTLVGQPLRFSRGRIGFDGGPLLDPTLDLEARATAAGGTAILAVSGTVGAPRVELRGEPPMPQEEVLSRLLFGVGGGRLTPWQATRLGLAAASLAGTGTSGPGVLARAGRGLGLGRLGLLPDDRGEGDIEGRRDLGDRAQLGARQSSRTGEPQGVVRLEAGPRVRVEADVGPIGGSRAGVAFEHEF